MRAGRGLLAAMLCVLLSGCGGESPTGPSSSSLTGVWTGTITEVAGGAGTLRLDLVHSGALVTGSFQATFSDARLNRTGVVNGGLLGSSLSIGLASGVLVCSPSLTLSGTLAATIAREGERLVGTYSGFTCEGGVGGNIDVSRVP